MGKILLAVFVEWVKGNPICHPASSAYYTIPYEMEAYANEGNPDYPVNYNGNNLSRYKIKVVGRSCTNRLAALLKRGNLYKNFIKLIL